MKKYEEKTFYYLESDGMLYRQVVSYHGDTRIPYALEYYDPDSTNHKWDLPVWFVNIENLKALDEEEAFLLMI